MNNLKVKKLNFKRQYITKVCNNKYEFHFGKLYIGGILGGILGYGIYECNQEIKKQKSLDNINKNEIVGKTTEGFTEGFFVGLFGPITYPMLIIKNSVIGIAKIITDIALYFHK